MKRRNFLRLCSVATAGAALNPAYALEQVGTIPREDIIESEVFDSILGLETKPEDFKKEVFASTEKPDFEVVIFTPPQMDTTYDGGDSIILEGVGKYVSSTTHRIAINLGETSEVYFLPELTFGEVGEDFKRRFSVIEFEEGKGIYFIQEFQNITSFVSYNPTIQNGKAAIKWQRDFREIEINEKRDLRVRSGELFGLAKIIDYLSFEMNARSNGSYPGIEENIFRRLQKSTPSPKPRMIVPYVPNNLV